VERARRWMKLILTAGAQLASIALSRAAAARWGAYLGWQGDGSRWGRGLVRSSGPHSCEFLAAGIFRLARQGASHFPELQHRHHERRRRPPTAVTAHHRNHVRRLPINWLPPARACPAALCDTRFRPRLPHILDQRGHSPRAQDDLRRCTCCAPQERLYSDQEGRCCRGHEARPGLQRRCRLQDLVRCSEAQPIKGQLMKLAATSPPSPSASWTAASLARASLPLFCLAPPSTSRPAKSGTTVLVHLQRARHTY
jgi:hypothetical protein